MTGKRYFSLFGRCRGRVEDMTIESAVARQSEARAMGDGRRS